MKFHTCGIHKENAKGSAKLQVTFDEDYNLPDYKPDISAVIMKQGSVSIEEVKVTKGHVWVKGLIKFDVLYRAEQNSLGFCSTSGSITFQENIVMDAAEEFDSASVEHVLEDLTVHITNSRKLAIRGLILLKVTLSEFEDVEVPCALEDASGVEVLTSSLSYLQLQDVGRDQCRVHEELELPGNKLNVQAVIWKELRMEDTSITPLDGSLLVKGELSVFCLYQAEPGIRMEWYEHRLPIQCRMDVPAAEVGGICYAKILDNDWSLSVSNDSEGEMRMLCIDGVIKIEYRLYQEKETDCVKDLYALDCKLCPQTKPLTLERLLMKNDSKYKVNDLLTIEPGKKEILQLCNCSGTIQVDKQEMIRDGILVEGAVMVQVLYLTEDDAIPLDAATGVIPFQYTVEAPGITKACRYELKASLSLLNVMMKSSTTLEVSALLAFDLIVFVKEEMENMISVQKEALELEQILSMPGVCGIRTKQGDTLWSIAKANHTTQEAIRLNNPDLEEPIRPGTVLLLLKQME